MNWFSTIIAKGLKEAQIKRNIFRISFQTYNYKESSPSELNYTRKKNLKITAD